MEFTYASYIELIELLKQHEYQVVSYENRSSNSEKCVILRHDIDMSIEKAVKLAECEQDAGVYGTYFVLLTSDFYNAFSYKSIEGLKKIQKAGGQIGLHFDEMQYPELWGNVSEIKEKILLEKECLEKIIERPVVVVSMHRPSKQVLDADIQIPGMINSYANEYFHQFKYISDSRRHWREPVKDIIKSEEYRKLHILTHAFWYNHEEENIHESVSKFVNMANRERYDTFTRNITDMNLIMQENEIK